MPDISRRAMAAGAGLLAGVLALPARTQQVEQLATAAAAPKFRVQPLTYNPEKISGLSAKLITSHHDEHYAGAVRDHALSLACLRHGLPAVQARGYDDLPADVLAAFDGTHIGSLRAEEIGHALSRALQALFHEAKEAGVATVESVRERLGDRG